MSIRPVPLKLITAIGIGLLILGFILFFQSLGRGGGLVPVSLMLSGATAVATAFVIAVLRAFRTKRQQPSK